MEKIWENLLPEMSKKIIAHVGKKSLFQQLYGGPIPLSCLKIIQNVKIKEILNGRQIFVGRDLVKKNLDFIVSLFKGSFDLKNGLLFSSSLLKFAFVYMKKAGKIARRVSSELKVLKHYIHSVMKCTYIVDGHGSFPIEFENCDEFVKFFIYNELYILLDTNILKEEFFNHIPIQSYYDLYEFLPKNVEKIN